MLTARNAGRGTSELLRLKVKMTEDELDEPLEELMRTEKALISRVLCVVHYSGRQVSAGRTWRLCSKC